MPIERSRRLEKPSSSSTGQDVIHDQSLTERTRKMPALEFTERQVNDYDRLIQSQQHAREIDRRQRQEIKKLEDRYKGRFDNPNYILKRAEMEAKHTQEVTDLRTEHRFEREELVSTQRTELMERQGRQNADTGSRWSF